LIKVLLRVMGSYKYNYLTAVIAQIRLHFGG
jgi:hypothetical protein